MMSVTNFGSSNVELVNLARALPAQRMARRIGPLQPGDTTPALEGVRQKLR